MLEGNVNLHGTEARISGERNTGKRNCSTNRKLEKTRLPAKGYVDRMTLLRVLKNNFGREKEQTVQGNPKEELQGSGKNLELRNGSRQGSLATTYCQPAFERGKCDLKKGVFYFLVGRRDSQGVKTLRGWHGWRKHGAYYCGKNVRKKRGEKSSPTTQTCAQVRTERTEYIIQPPKTKGNQLQKSPGIGPKTKGKRTRPSTLSRARTGWREGKGG